MRGLFLMGFLLLQVPSALAGSAKIKGGVVYYDAVPVFKYEGAMRIEGSVAMVHSAKTDEKLFTVRYEGNPDGYQHLDVKFIGDDGRATRFMVATFKKLFEMLVDNGVVDVEGVLHLDKAREFSEMYGREVLDITF